MVNAKIKLIFQNLYAEIYCRDCLRTSCSLFHVLGIKCKHCKGYNTVRERGPLMRKQGENDCKLTNCIDRQISCLLHMFGKDRVLLWFGSIGLGLV